MDYELSTKISHMSTHTKVRKQFCVNLNAKKNRYTRADIHKHSILTANIRKLASILFQVEYVYYIYLVVVEYSNRPKMVLPESTYVRWTGETVSTKAQI